jgi:hypothetical protein
MNCHEARERLTSVLAGKFGLTEWATVEAHVRQCAECGQALDQLYRMAPADRTRGPAGTARVPHPGRSGRPTSLLRLAVVSSVLVALMGLGVYALERRSEAWLAHLRSAPPAAPEPGPLSGDGRGQAAPLEPVAPPPVTEAAEPERQDVVQAERASRAPAAEAERAPRAPAAKAERAPRAPAAKAEPPVEPVLPAAASGTDIVIQLSVADRRAAARDVKTLLARLGGTSLGRESASTMILVVRRSSYGELTRGLAQIGSWQMESDPGPLPDPVHVAVRLAK